MDWKQTHHGETHPIEDHCHDLIHELVGGCIAFQDMKNLQTIRVNDNEHG